MNDLISVIIPSYNTGSFVCDAVRSALEQTFSPIEVLVIDDGSTDKTRAALEQYKDCIRYYRQENGGCSSARNTGIRLASGRFFAFLDADDVWLPDKLSKQYDLLARRPEIGLVHSDIWYLDEDTGEKFLKAVGREGFTGDCYTRFFSENRILTSSVLVRQECFDKVGVFDEKLRRAEDWDMWMRIARHYHFAYINESLLDYRLHHASLTNNTSKMREAELHVLSKAFKADPQLSRQFGRSFINNTLSHKSYCVGNHFLREGNFRVARHYFGISILFNPTHIVNILPYFLWCFLPYKITSRLVHIKKRYLPEYTLPDY
jgi:glycosyltransferase involved in cell wall biosynthesis